MPRFTPIAFDGAVAIRPVLVTADGGNGEILFGGGGVNRVTREKTCLGWPSRVASFGADKP